MIILFIGKYHYFENMPVMLLAGFLKMHGHECHYLDLKFERNYLRKVKEINPAIIAYSVTTGIHRYYMEVNLKIKKEHTFTSVFGGPHCTVFPEMINEPGVDIICRGEGELPLLELANLLGNNQDITQIKNLWINQNGKIYKNELRSLVQNIDEITSPDRTIFDKYRHYRKIQRRIIITSRGCPYNCTYCYNNLIKEIMSGKGKYVRMRSVDNVLAELQSVKNKYHPRRIKFIDDTFLMDKKWAYDFCERYKNEIHIPFVACIRINLIDEELIKAMKDAGCISVEFGLESGDTAIRNDLLKRNISDRDIIDVSLMFKKYGIKAMSLNMVGLPGETIKQCITTIKLNIKAKVAFAHAMMYTPLPLTELTQYSIEKGFFDGNHAGISYNYMYNDSCLKMKDTKKIKRLQYLFSSFVAFPFLLPIHSVLLNLPFKILYRAVFFIHRFINQFFITKQITIYDLFITEFFTKKHKKT